MNLVRIFQNHLRLLEVAQVPKDNIEDFKSVKKFNVFNTNNLWISLPAVQRVIEEGTLDMEVIVNPKTLDGGINVIQLEVTSSSIGIVFGGFYIWAYITAYYCSGKMFIERLAH